MSDNPRRLNLPTIPHAAPSDPSGPMEHANGVQQPSLDYPTPLKRGDARGGMVSDRVVWLDLPRPYDNLEILAWLDFPKSIDDIRLAPALAPGMTESAEDQNNRFVLFCQNVILDHREACHHGGDPDTCTQEHGPWLDRNGEPMLPPEDREFWDRLSTPLGGAIMTRFWEEIRDSPKSSGSRKRKRASWKRR